ncbi:polyamine transporter 3 [Penicillium malachiteum]|uniref:polyamine transporter 3 n=1 Tax=Penicillium malachiteum TaxID=1324776 RepID=UPI0025470A58|nr:polyamine transporter 3 [Penicillium malachiteum]KAJ5737627.1 polyamine transporter 3 [Penicillium malachiteum]
MSIQRETSTVRELENGSIQSEKVLGDPENPKNWTSMRKWKTIFAMSSFVFMSPLSSRIVAPALPAIASDLNITQPAVEKMVLSIFLLGFACGPLVASPLSEVYGRERVVQT